MTWSPTERTQVEDIEKKTDKEKSLKLSKKIKKGKIIANLYGKPKPINPNRLISAEEGFELSLGKLNIKALHTPGHAPHHITWICNTDAFVGDSAGLWNPHLEKSFPVTPGYYRHDLALQSIEKMALLDLEYLHYTHFGPRKAVNVFE